MADDKCFELNVKGNANGNCGRDRVNDNYTMCAVRDTKCGLLHCTSQVERLAIGAESATSVSQSFIPARTTYISCRYFRSQSQITDKTDTAYGRQK